MTWVAITEDGATFRLYIRNDSDRVHRIVAIALSDCRNIEPTCTRHAVDVVLCPGQSQAAFRLDRHTPDSSERVYFDWSFEARDYERGEPVAGSDCSVTPGPDPAAGPRPEDSA